LHHLVRGGEANCLAAAGPYQGMPLGIPQVQPKKVQN